MTTTNFPDGVTNVGQDSAMRSLIIPDPSSVHAWFDDFNNFTAANWVVTTTGTGTTAVGNADGGILAVTNTAGATDAKFLQASDGVSAVAETFKFETGPVGKQLWFKTRFKVSDATASAAVIGLQITDTTPLVASDGVYFLKSAGSAAVSLVIAQASTTTTTPITTLVSDTYVELAFHYNGQSTLNAFVNGSRVASPATTNLPLTQTLAVSFGIQNGAAAAKVMSVDYIFAAKER